MDKKAPAPLVVPSINATPKEIREYFAQVIIASVASITAQEVNIITSAWKVGTGRELRQYGANIYLDLFGPEHGWLLYTHTRLALKNEETSLGWEKWHITMALLVNCVVQIATFFEMRRAGEPWVREWGWYVAVGGIGLAVVLFYLRFTWKSGEERVVEELRRVGRCR